MSSNPTPPTPEPPKRRGPLRFLLELVAAPFVLFEAWGWEPLQRLIGRLARFRLIERFEAIIAAFPPYAALATFAAPAIALFPVKLVSLYLMASGHIGMGICVLIGAKVAGTALVARLFHLTQPQLMRIRWFAAVYNRVVPWKNALLARLHATAVWRGMTAFAFDVRKTVSGWVARIRRRS